MQRLGKTFLVWTVVLLTAVDPASACRWRVSRCCAPSCCYTYYTPCCEVVDCCTSGSSETPEPEMAPTPARPSEKKKQPTPARPAPTPAPRDEEVPPAPAAMPAPADEMPTEEPAPEPPAETPAPTEDEMPEEPAKPAKPAEDVEDLFKDSDSKETETARPAEAKPGDKTDDADDLFKDSDKDSKKAAVIDQAPASEVKSADNNVEDLFVDPTDAAKTAADEAPVNSMRVWTDNTGKFQVTARLVVVGPKHVRLLKDNGRLTTVPFERLSRSDLAFVHSQAVGAIAGNF